MREKYGFTAFPEVEAVKNKPSKCGFMSHRNNKKLVVRLLKPSEIALDTEKLGPIQSTKN